MIIHAPDNQGGDLAPPDFQEPPTQALQDMTRSTESGDPPVWFYTAVQNTPQAVAQVLAIHDAVQNGFQDAIQATQFIPTIQAAIHAAVASAVQAAIPPAVNAAVQATIPPAVNAAVQATIPPAVNAAVQAAIPPAVDAAFAPIYRLLAQDYNLHSGDGVEFPFHVICNQAGIDPRTVNLIPLKNVGIIRGLDFQVAGQYCQFYNIDPAPLLSTHLRHSALATEIGCHVAV